MLDADGRLRDLSGDGEPVITRIINNAAGYSGSGRDRLPEFTLDELKAEMAEVPRAVPLLEADVAHVLTVEGSLAARQHIGGTAPTQVRAAIARARAALA